MISKILFTNALPFVDGQSSILNLKKINTFYGSNGSGKTTLSRIIGGVWEQAKVSISWENDLIREVLVFNRDFIKNNFSPRIPLKGIFVVGESVLDIDNRIQGLRSEIIELETKLDYLFEDLNGTEKTQGKRADLQALNDGYLEKFYSAKRNFGKIFAIAYKGHQHTKKKFMEKLVMEYRTNASELKPFEYLSQQVTTLAIARVVASEYIQEVSFDSLLELGKEHVLTESIQVERVFGFSKLIDDLQNAEWVFQGMHYYKQNLETCPFCQQKTRKTLETDLNKAFGNNYKTKVDRIRSLYSAYQAESKAISLKFDKLINSDNEFIDKTMLVNTIRLFETIVRQNLKKIEEKILDPTRIVTLLLLNEVIDSAKDVVNQANQKVYETNLQYENRKELSEELARRIWKYTVNLFDSDLSQYFKESSEIEKQIENLEDEIETVQGAIIDKRAILHDLESKTANIQPAIDGINRLLEAFGFNSFRIVRSEDRYYQIKRLDNSDALMSLSEGEGRLLSFLYYYYLINGGHSKDDISSDKVVVIDDPTSGLDSQSKFIVSSLIRRLIYTAKKGTSKFKQVFILSHDLEFLQHVQPTADLNTAFQDEMQGFWLLKKNIEGTSIVSLTDPTMFNLDGMLWMVINDESKDPQMVKATLIQILENYFFFGDEKLPENISLMFDDYQRQLFFELCPWFELNPLIIDNPKDSEFNIQPVNRYLEVFQKIFYNAGYKEYFEKMMKISR